MVKRGTEIKQPHGRNKQDRAGEKCLARLTRRGQAKKRSSNHRRRQTEAMAETIGDLFAPGLVPVRRREQLVYDFHAFAGRSIVVS